MDNAYMKTMSHATMRRMASCPAQWMILIKPAMSGTSIASETTRPRRSMWISFGGSLQCSP